MRSLLLVLILLPQAVAADSFEKLRQEWARDLHEKRVEASTALYSPDGVFIQPDGTRVKGSTAIHNLYKKLRRPSIAIRISHLSGSRHPRTLRTIPVLTPRH